MTVGGVCTSSVEKSGSIRIICVCMVGGSEIILCSGAVLWQFCKGWQHHGNIANRNQLSVATVASTHHSTCRYDALRFKANWMLCAWIISSPWYKMFHYQRYWVAKYKKTQILDGYNHFSCQLMNECVVYAIATELDPNINFPKSTLKWALSSYDNTVLVIAREHSVAKYLVIHLAQIWKHYQVLSASIT